MNGLVFLFIVLMSSGILWAKEKAPCQRTYYVSVTRFEPLSYLDAQGKLVGMVYDIGKELEARSGCKFSIQEKSYRAMWRDLELHRTDMTMINVENFRMGIGESGIFIPLFIGRRTFIFRKGYLEKGRSWQDLLSDKRSRFVGLVGANVLYKRNEIELLKRNGLYIETSDYETAAKMLQEKRADVLLFPAAVGKILLNKLPLGHGLETLLDQDNSYRAGVYLSKRRLNSSERKKIEGILLDLKAEGLMEKLVDGYVKRSERSDSLK